MLSLGQSLLGQANLSAVRMAWHIWDERATGGPDLHGVDFNFKSGLGKLPQGHLYINY